MLYSLTKYVIEAKRYGIEIFLLPDDNETAKSFAGIHLLMPKEYELSNAISDAHSEGFKTIYIHNSY